MAEEKIVVLPGWGHDAGSWEAFKDRFPDGKVRVLELPGFGKEPLVSGEWGVPEYAEWTARQLAQEPAGSIILIGHSFGGRIAAYLAKSHPAWLSRLVLYGAPLLRRPSVQVRARIALAKVLSPVFGSLARMAAYKGEELRDAEARGMGTVFRKVVGFDQTEYLPRVNVPTFMLWGERDSEAPVALAQEAAKLIPHASLAILPGVGHNVHLERPDLFYGQVARFIRAT